jgi:ADP-heptose:LPS heptosyltransferase
MKRGILFRPGHAIGDAVFTTPVPRLLKEQGYDVVDIACQEHNFEVYKNNPYVNEMIKVPRVEDATKEWNDNFQEKLKTYDKVFAASGHVEMGLLQRTDADWGNIPSGAERQEKAKDVNYQDYIFKAMGIETTGHLPEFYFDDEEKAQIQNMKDQLNKDKQKLVLWNWTGSSKSKNLVFGPMYLQKVLERHQHSMHYVFSQDPNMARQIPDNPRAFNAWGASTIRNTIQMCSIASMVIGPESFLVNAAAAFDTPKMIFFSHSAPENLAKYYKNCTAVTPLQSVKCYPCYLIHVDFRTVFHPEKRAIAREYERNCETVTNKNPYRLMGYKCCFFLPHNEIVNNILITLKRGK